MMIMTITTTAKIPPITPPAIAPPLLPPLSLSPSLILESIILKMSNKVSVYACMYTLLYNSAGTKLLNISKVQIRGQETFKK